MRTDDPVGERDRQQPFGIGVLTFLFASTAVASAACALSIHGMGVQGIGLLAFAAGVSSLCTIGLWRGAAWGRTLTVVVLVETGLAATALVVVNGDPRGILAQPIVAGLAAYLLLSPRVRRFFRGASGSADPSHDYRRRIPSHIGS